MSVRNTQIQVKYAVASVSLIGDDLSFSKAHRGQDSSKTHQDSLPLVGPERTVKHLPWGLIFLFYWRTLRVLSIFELFFLMSYCCNNYYLDWRNKLIPKQRRKVGCFLDTRCMPLKRKP